MLNINAPLSNYAGDGPIPAPQSPMQGANAGGNMFGPQNDSFQKTSGSGNANAPFSPNPFASPEQNLENYYKEAVKKRQEAENFRNDYLNFANQMSGQAYQNKMSPFGLSNSIPSAFPPPAPQPNPAQEQQAFQQQLQQLQQAQQLQQMQQKMQEQAMQLQQMQTKVQQEQEAAQQAAQQSQLLQQQQQDQLQQMQQQALLQQQQAATQTPAGAPPQYNPYDPMAMAAQQQAGMQPQGAQPQYNPYDPMAMAAQQQAAMQPQGAPPQYNPYDPMAMAAQQQAGMQQPMAQQQDPAAMQQQQPQGLGAASVADLNNMLLQPQSPKDKLDAINEIAMRQQGDRQTYELLKQEAVNSTPGLQPDDANLIRQASLFALGNLNRVQNAQVPTNQLPGMDAINRIINNKAENPAVKSAAITALGYIDRPQDRLIQNLLKKASKDKNPDVKQAVAQVQSGMMSAAAQQGQGMQAPGVAAPPPQYAPQDAMAGQYDPAMLQQLLQQQAPPPAYSPVAPAQPQGYPYDQKLQQQGGMPMPQPGMAQMF